MNELILKVSKSYIVFFFQIREDVTGFTFWKLLFIFYFFTYASKREKTVNCSTLYTTPKSESPNYRSETVQTAYSLKKRIDI